MNKKLFVSALVGSAVVSLPAFATGTDIATLFGGVDITDVKTQVMTIGAVIIGVALVMKGITLVKSTIGKI